jgi:hypothetical protein
MDFTELKKKTVVQLREMAGEYEDITGVSGMKKADLLEALADKLGIEKDAAGPKPASKKARGKGAIKKRIQELKAQRDKALQEKDGETLKKVRRQLHRQKVILRRTVV